MLVTVESTGTLERRMRVELPAERIEKEVDARLKSVARTAKIKGFRPGKIPPKVVRQHYGVQVRQEVLSDLMNKSYSDAIQQENLQPVARPMIEPESADGSKDFAYVATFDVLPEVTLRDLDKIEVSRPEVEIGDEDRDEMISNLRRQRATWNSVERESEEGDRVVVDFDGTIKGQRSPDSARPRCNAAGIRESPLRYESRGREKIQGQIPEGLPLRGYAGQESRLFDQGTSRRGGRASAPR